MEAPARQPLASPALALDLLHTPPAPIPKSDPLLVGRSYLLKSPGDAPHAEASGPPPQSLCPEEVDSGQHHSAGPSEPPARHAAAAGTPPRTTGAAPAPASAASAPRQDGGGAAGCYRQLPSHAAADLSYDDFVRQYMAPNKPVVIRGVTTGWRASAEWRTPEGRLGLEALEQLAGHCTVCVTDTSNQDDGCGVVRTMTLSEYLAWWNRRAAANTHQQQQPQQQPHQQPELLSQQPQQQRQQQQQPQQPMQPHCSCGAAAATDVPPAAATAPCLGSHAAAGAASERGGGIGGQAASGGALVAGDEGLMYLKDWHFVAEFPGFGAYRLPIYFADDWLNDYYDQRAAETAGTPQPAAAVAAAAAVERCSGQEAAPADDTPATGTATDAPAAAAAEPGRNPLQQHQPQQPHHTAPSFGQQRPAERFPSAPPPPPRAMAGPSCNDGAGCCCGGEAAAAAADTAAADAYGVGGCESGGGTPPEAFTSDYRFFYLGPAGTWTPVHSDVLRSHSWSANVCGRKRWLLLDPRHTHLLYDKRVLRLAPHLELDRVANGCDPRDFPGLEEARRHAFEFIQEAGDAVFVPSGWHHCVENMEDTLSINHNWLNGHNCHWTWALLRQQYADAAAAIEDCRPLCPPDEFEALVQSNLAANAGLHWQGFVELVGGAARRALAALRAAGPRAAAGPCVRTWGAAEAAAAGHEVMNALLALQRAGGVLKDYVIAFEELVIMPAEKLSRRYRRDGDNLRDEAIQRLWQTSSLLAARGLLSDITHELHSRGFCVLPVGYSVAAGGLSD